MNAKYVRVCALLGGMAVLASACGRAKEPASWPTAQAHALEEIDDRASAEYGEWSLAVPVEGINSPANENHPAISKNGLSLYFTSDRKGLGALGGEDIWVSHRASLDDPWGKPVTLGPNINSWGNDRAPNLTNDGASFTSTATAAAGTAVPTCSFPGGRTSTMLWDGNQR